MSNASGVARWLISRIPASIRSGLKACGARVVVIVGTWYRHLMLRHVVFIGVTGSCGKSTTKELIAAVLGGRFDVRKSPGNVNQPFPLAKVILRVPWSADYCVVELTPAGMKERLVFEQPLRLSNPQIGVVTNIGDDHLAMFGSRDGIASEKGKLIAALPKNGVAILNADDPRVAHMRTRCAGRVITYGAAPEAMLRAENIQASWPNRLSFTATYQGESHVIQTQLCGAHWVHSVLAAIATGITAGMTLAEIAQVLRGVKPFTRRLAPVESAGITFVRDDWKASLGTIPAAFEFMKQAKAPCKIIVLGTISDYGNSNLLGRRIYPSLGAQALEAADRAVFIGPQASKCLKARRHPDDGALQAFYSIDHARPYLRELLQPGDLVLIKGSRRQDNFEGVIQDVVCRAESQRKTPSSRAGTRGGTQQRHIDPAADYVIVGLGNRGEQYRDTWHNVGQQVLDTLAARLRVSWTSTDHGFVAAATWRGQRLYMVKPNSNMNDTGRVVRQLWDDMGFAPAACILVHDDIQLPPGTARTRIGGRDGGHRGVRSVHQALGTDIMPRVKIGIGKPSDPEQIAEFVSTRFLPSEATVVDAACVQAAEHVLSLVDGRITIPGQPHHSGKTPPNI